MEGKTNDKKLILSGILNSLKYSIIAAVALGVIGTLISRVRHTHVIQGIYLSYYCFGVFALIFAIPQLYKRDEDSKTRRVRLLSPLYGFYNIFNNPYAEREMVNSFEEFKGDGFWVGIDIVIFSLALFFYAFIIENIYYIYFRG